ncbi:MAG: hypothetical protein KDJ65_15895 [Anaerolineae bacterium]|nr:hypothetical protein [Anaerolineae bacterium]
MVRVQYDTNSDYSLYFPHPQERDAIVKLGEAFVAYERSRPPEQRTPYFPLVVDVLQQVEANRHIIQDSRSKRAIASESIKQLDRRLADCTRQIWLAVGAACKDATAEAVNWGLSFNQTTQNIILPQGRANRLTLLKQYIAYETSRDEALRFMKPDLAEAIRIRDSLEAYQKQYENGQNSVSIHIADNKILAELLLKHLQSASVHLLAFEFGYKLTRAIQAWGYDVVERR